METITLPTQFVQQLVNYLTTRPWGEVNAFITTLLEAAKPAQAINGRIGRQESGQETFERAVPKPQ